MNMISATTIDDAWRQAMMMCNERGYEYVIEKGSYETEVRKQLECVAIEINTPHIRPLAPILPPSCPFRPTDDDAIDKYFVKYLMSDFVENNEEYTYGTFISAQVNKVIEYLNISHGNTNQAVITVGDNNSVNLLDPPCLKLIDFKLVNNKLNMTVVFRSWDLVSAFPENLGGLQLLKEFVHAHLEFPCELGKTFAYSAGLHIYKQYEDLVKMLCF